MDAHDQTGVALAIIGAGVALFLGSLPLIYRRVPMNRFYGTGLGDLYKSQQRWYDIDAYSGRRGCVVVVADCSHRCRRPSSAQPLRIYLRSDCDCRYSRDRADPGRADNALDKCN